MNKEKFAGLTLVEVESELNKINDLMTNTWFMVGFVGGLLSLIVLFIAYLFAYADKDVPVKYPKFKTGYNYFLKALFFAVIIMFIKGSIAVAEEEILLELKEELLTKQEEQYIEDFSKKEVSTIEIDSIRYREVIDNNYCPNISELTKCHFIEYSTGDKKGQAILPINIKRVKDFDSKMTIQYYIMSNEDVAAYLDNAGSIQSDFEHNQLNKEKLIIGDLLIQ